MGARRLPTKDMLSRFGVVMDGGCGMCSSGLESRDHLFFDCAYAKEIWTAILLSCGLSQTPLDWYGSFQWLLLNLKGKSLLVHILRLAWTGFIYFIWEERNHIHFGGTHRLAGAVVSCIKESVRIKLHITHMNRIDDVNRELCIY
ncbi:uncharacterized protein LOC120119296 [Hibiscus syriacus]|uniref:uncharacterized protein LOC120119296 n=1 Tax=Hibiscus syriacus TaxID=106335 RepID=UPI001922945F|nr:uncharacterized protein LOC120119296 [Hibiscus syriacus]